MERDKQQPTLDDRIRFVARHYREGRFDEEAAWRCFASSHGNPAGKSVRMEMGVGCGSSVVVRLLYILYNV